MKRVPNKPVKTLTALLDSRAEEQPDRRIYTFLAEGEREQETLTRAELAVQARVIAALLEAEGVKAGDRVLLLYPPGLAFLPAFFGCLRHGALAVPAYPPSGNRNLAGVLGIAQDAQPIAAVLTVSQTASRSRDAIQRSEALRRARWLVTDDLPKSDSGSHTAYAATPDTLAFLQYTSGSTANPKGVMVSHGNLLQNQSIIARVFGQTDESVIVGWLPFYHDMGLIGNLLQPLYAGAQSVLMAPASFLQRPVRWLRAISRFRGATSGGPNFAYDLCVDQIGEEEKAGLDLSSWTVAFNGAEPVRADTIGRFAEAFERSGFRRDAFRPCYGLAEATLLVSARRAEDPLLVKKRAAREIEFNANQETLEETGPGEIVSCGRIPSELRVAVVDPDTMRERPIGQAGEVCVSGSSVAQGYWNRPAESREIFGASVGESGEGPYLRTGDLGFVLDGELFLTGRLKDLVILRGRNYYPEEIERIVGSCHHALRRGAGAAFSVEARGQERLVVVQEVKRRNRRDDVDEIVEAIRRTIAEEYEIQAFAVVMAEPRAVPKTSSGKVRRRECRNAFLSGTLRAIHVWRESRPSFVPGSSHGQNPFDATLQTEAWLAAEISGYFGVDEASIDPLKPLVSLGLDSLAATQLLFRIEERLGLKLQVTDLLHASTLSKLADHLRTPRAGGEQIALAGREPITKDVLHRAAGTPREFPLSEGQQSLFFLQRMTPESAAYNIAGAVRFHFELDVAALDRAFKRVVQRHPCWTAAFSMRDGRVTQVVDPSAEISFEHQDAAGQSLEEIGEAASNLARRPFDLLNEPVLRIRLFTRANDDHVLLLIAHHIAADFWSLSLAARELGLLYIEETGGPPAHLAQLDFTYADYVRWQSKMLEGGEGRRLWEYWRDRLAGELTPLALPADFSAPHDESHDGASLHFVIGRELITRLKAAAYSEGATTYMILLAAFQALLSQYSGQRDILVGSPASGRTRPEFHGIVGYFVNTIVIRGDLSRNPSFTEFLRRIRETVLGALAHQDYPFGLIVEKLQPDREPGQSPIFQVMFSLQGTPGSEDRDLSLFAAGKAGARAKIGGLPVESIALSRRPVHYSLTLLAAEAGGELHAAFQYKTGLFEETTIGRLIGRFNVLLDAISRRPDLPVWELPLLSGSERQQLLIEWSDTDAACPAASVQELFEAVVRRIPEKVAVEYSGHNVTYQELNERADHLADFLRERGVRPEAVVGLFTTRSIEMVVGLLGVLKTGAAYLPLDPIYPQARLAFMLDDSGAGIVVTERALCDALPASGVNRIRLDVDWDAIASAKRSGSPGNVAADNLAYVVYTSGSTGTPKGVSVTQRSLVNFLASMLAEPGIECNDVLLAVTTLSFDIAALEIFLPLIAGARVVVAGQEDTIDGRALIGAMNDCGATIMQGTPVTWRLLIEAGWEGRAWLKALCGGEALTPDLLRQLLTRTASLWNMYGPSETTVWSAALRLDRDDCLIGKPIANTQVYILNSLMEPAPTGALGDLHIGGMGLARGYLGRPDLTAERFAPDPFGAAGSRLYDAGDRARYAADGRIAFLGRRDTQVKIRGYRIEAGEIEALLERHPLVRQAVVTVRGEGADKRLVAYVAGGGTDRETESLLKAHVRRLAPEYMVPASVVTLPSLPLTPNGKVDRSALPEPETRNHAEAGLDTRTPTEEMIAGIWSDVLGLREVGVDDDFFERGGHSLAALRVVSRVEEAVGVTLPVKRIFESPTVRLLAESINAGSGRALNRPLLTRRDDNERRVLSFSQQRLWFIDQLEPTSALYNIPAGARLQGALNVEALRQSIEAITSRHEILRTRFRTEDGEPFQEVVPYQPALLLADLSSLGEDEREVEALSLLAVQARRAFDISRLPLIRWLLIRLRPDLHIIAVVVHHIVCDGWSIGVLIRELARFLQDFAEGAHCRLEPLPVQYADYAYWQREWIGRESPADQLAYWRTRLSGTPALLELPTDRPRSAALSHDGSTVSIELTEAASSELKKMSAKRGVTVFMTLLAAFEALLHRYSGFEDLVIGAPMANRRVEQTERLIGFFVNTVVIRSRVTAEMRFEDLLRDVRETVLEAYDHQDLPFERLVEELHPDRSAARNPLFEIMFAFQNEWFRQAAFPGIEATPIHVDAGAAKFDLTLNVEESDRRYALLLEYKTGLYDSVTVQKMLRHLERLLACVSAESGLPIHGIPLLSEEEWKQAVLSGDGGRRQGAIAATINQLLDQQAEQEPDRAAVVHGAEQITYGELSRRAGRLALYLRERGLRGEPVGVFLDRGVDMIVAVIGVLKAGAPYVPLDPNYASERTGFVLEDAGVRLIVTRQALEGRLPGEFDKICLDADRIEIARRPHEISGDFGGPDTPAYIIYTSGSSGRPKGVIVSHRNLVHSTVARLLYYSEAPRSFLLLSSFAFDSSVAGLFWTLCHGGALVLPAEELHQDLSHIEEVILRNRVTHLLCLPALYEALLRGSNAASLSPLRLAIVAGEACPPRVVEHHKAILPTTRLFNEYGPTEATVWCTAFDCDSFSGAASTPIGKPIPNAEVYVVDAHLNPTPSVAPGELLVGGGGVACGYLNRPDLTAEKFIPDPFSARTGTRLYKTGDLARVSHDGCIEYIGRLDNQLKIRGFRIEAGEIEARLNDHPSVRQSVVIARESASKERRLVAYVAADDYPGGLDAVLAKHLRETLPEYMVPSAILILDRLPLTSNGKIDRLALPEADSPPAVVEITRPASPIEDIIAGIWTELLDRPRCGVHENFFDLGGHSLLAAQAASRISKSFSVTLTVRSLFEHPTIAGLAEAVEAARKKRLPLPPPFTRDPLASRNPLSHQQQRLWFLDRFEPESAAYNIAAAVRISGSLDQTALVESLNQVVRRHQILRTRFLEEKGVPVQEVPPHEPIALRVIDLSAMNGSIRNLRTNRILTDEASKPFNLEQGSPARWVLIRESAYEHILLAVIHHIVSDGWSAGILLKELSALYGSFIRGEPPDSEEPPLQYGDYARWQREWLDGPALEALLSYWEGALEGTEILELPADRPRPPARTFKGATEQGRLAEDLADRVRLLARRNGATPFMALLASFKLLIHGYTGQGDLAVGSPVANRGHEELEGLIGFFVNTLVLRTRIIEDQSFIDYLKHVRGATLDAYTHQDLPFEKLVEELQPERSLIRNPLFQVMFAYQNAPIPDLEMGGLKMRPFRAETGTAKFDLTASVDDLDGGFGVYFEYNTDLFDQETIRRMMGHWEQVIRSAVEQPERRLRDTNLLTEAEMRCLTLDWNQTASRPAQATTIHGMIDAQARLTPERIALRRGGAAVSYGEMNRRADQFSAYLRRQGARPEILVGVAMNRNIELVITLLAVMKTGAAYLPIDPRYPLERVAFMLEDAEAAMIVTEQSLVDKIPEGAAALIVLDAEQDRVAPFDGERVASLAAPENLAYVIYTSGSTGKPKGAAIEHRSAVELIGWSRSVFSDEDLQGVLASTSICFDLSVFELFVTLARGGSVVLAEDVFDGVESPTRDWVTLINTVPSAMAELARQDGLGSSVRIVNLAGEPLEAELVERVYSTAAVERVLNLYGPTEDTTYSTCEEIERGNSRAPLIGRPITNTQLYVMDPNSRLAPIGAIGELCLGGEGLARGYLRRPGLTADRFRPDPCSTKPGSRLYRTGDLARFKRNGKVELRGRSDNQIKLRGYRIELGEIEAMLAKHPSVRQCAVAAKEQAGQKRVVGYVATKEDADFSRREIRNYLAERLPEYMLPALIVKIERMPLTPNGKLDRRALAAAEIAPDEKTDSAPATVVEEILAGIWTALLGVAKIARSDNFFELGGHSLLAMQLVSRVAECFAVQLRVRTIFERPTLEEFAAVVEGCRKKPADVPLRRAGAGESTRNPLSYAQQRLWFLDKWEPGSPLYNLPTAARIRGPLDIERLRSALNEIVRRHEILRTTFIEEEPGRPTQEVAQHAVHCLLEIDLTAIDSRERDGEALKLASVAAREPFHLSASPPARWRLITLGEADHVLVVVMHHIIGDGWSIGVLLREIARLYGVPAEGPASLDDLPFQYGDYALLERSWFGSRDFSEQAAYWRRQLAGVEGVIQLPYDRPPASAMSYAGAAESFLLGRDLTERLKEVSARQGATIFMTLVAGLNVLLHRLTGGAEDIVIGTPLANRKKAGTERLIGLFVNTLALRTRITGDLTFGRLVERTREMTLEAYDNAETPFEKIIEQLKLDRNASQNPLFQVAMALQNMSMPELEIGESRLTPIDLETKTSKFDLGFYLMETDGDLHLTIEYKTALFDQTTIRRIGDQYRNVLSSSAESLARPIREIEVMSSRERARILEEWNQTASAYPSGKTIHELFLEQADCTPHRVALTLEGDSISYGELNRRASQLACYLQGLGAGPETPVGILLNRSFDLMIAILGVLKSGGAYAPLDPDYPPERLDYMARDAGIEVVITRASLWPSPAEPPMRIVLMDEWRRWPSRQHPLNPICAASPENLAYVMYTSGSTGRPKGVMVTHRNVIRLVRGAHYASFGADDVFFHASPISFDASTLEIWGSLLNGATLVVHRGGKSSLMELAQAIERHNVTFLWLTSALFEQMIDHHIDSLDNVRQLLAGGDVLPVPQVKKALARSPARRVINGYGPTECTTFSCCGSIGREEELASRAPIGRPVDNARVYILDSAKCPVPIGVGGEINIGGDGLARGYLGGPGVTAERFVPDPYSAEPGQRIYRTGDLGKFLADGRIEFLGRIDNQIKIRGYRVEPAEIEAALHQHPAVSQAVVAPRGEGSRKSLAAYVVFVDGAEPGTAELREHLKSKLPDYLIPNVFVKLAALPMTANGKVDRKALPPAALDAAPRASIQPRNDLERVIARIWSEELAVTRLGIHDNFFDLGGHSLLATRVVTRLREELGVTLALQELFRAATIAEIASLARERGFVEGGLEPSRRTSYQALGAIDRQLSELDGLSPEEVKELLEMESRA